jgi:glycosyl hydrolase group 75 (putative chitosanase)
MRSIAGLTVVVFACTARMSGVDPSGPDADGSADAALDASPGMPAAPTAAELLARIATCDHAIGGPLADDSGGVPNRQICALPKAMFWKADLDIDCDGRMSAACSSATDPAYQNDTALHDSMDRPLDAAALPYVVVPGISARFDYVAAGLELGTVIAVIHGDKLEYGVFGDIGPRTIIGEASYRMAAQLGIDPDPSTGGADDGVSYIAFVDAVVDPVEDHDKAVMIGIAHARALLSTP